MLDFFKRHNKERAASSREEYLAEFECRRRALYQKFAVEDTPYDMLLDAMSAVENEMNRNGGQGTSNCPYGVVAATSLADSVGARRDCGLRR
jgi:hypothetical protein